MKLARTFSTMAIPAAMAASALVGVAASASAQDSAAKPYIFIPQSSIERAEDIGVRAHTNIQQYVVPGARMVPNAEGVIPDLIPGQQTPGSLACIYHIVPQTHGCTPGLANTLSNGGRKVIVIVDAFHNPTAKSDLAKFSALYHLPAPTSANFQQVFASGHKPPVDSGWQIEESLDVQWAHALAPKAKIILVEAADSSFPALAAADIKGAGFVKTAGGGEVSNSWGGSEFSGEQSLDSVYQQPKTVFLFSTGDHFGTQYPSVSPFVVAVGGTKINQSGSGAFLFESAWGSSPTDGTGGGLSSHEKRPTFQNPITSIVGVHRGVPDIAAEADPSSGVAIFVNGGIQGLWGGTSLAAPLVTAIINVAGHFEPSSPAENGLIYSHRSIASDFHDITKGHCGLPSGHAFNAVKGWDKCTGVGTPNGLAAK